MASRLNKLGFIDSRGTRAPVRRRVRSRGVPVALRDHEVLVTDRLKDAVEIVKRLLGSNTMRVHSDEGEPFQVSLNAVRVRDVTMAYLDFHTRVSVDIAATGDWYCVHMPTSGEALVTYRGETMTITPYAVLVTSPGEPVHVDFALDSPHVIIRIEAAAVERNVARMLGRSPGGRVRFDPVMDLTSDLAVRWHGAMQLLSTEILTAKSLIQLGAGAGQLEEFVVSTLLLIQGSSHRDALVRTPTRSGRRAVQRSLAYIEGNLAQPITLDDIAVHAKMSPRSVQQGFREDLGTTPMAYVRDQRLERVRARLVDALPQDGLSVTDVAQEWGFTHLGNFSAAYRRRFGETPSQTLRK